MFKTSFSGTTKYEGHKKSSGDTAPECPPWLRACNKVISLVFENLNVTILHDLVGYLFQLNNILSIHVGTLQLFD